MIKYFFPIICLFFVSDLAAQYGETIRTGRPGKSIGAFSVGERVLQVQSGVEYLQSTIADSERDLTQAVVIVRYGIARRIEFSTVWNINASEKITTPIGSSTLGGISGNQIGFRVNLSDGEKAPPMCFQYRLKLRLVSEDYQREFMGSRALFAIAYPLGNKVKTFTNLGLDWNGSSAAPTGVYALTFAFPLAPKVSAMAEYYGSVPVVNDLFNQTWDSNAGVGLSYTVSKDLKLDLSGGTNLTKANDLFFVNIGFSWRTRFNERIKTSIQPNQ